MFDPAEADALQHAWLLPFEFLDLTPELGTITPALVTEDGAVLQPSDPPGAGESELAAAAPAFGRRTNYAVAVRLPGREQVVATSAEASAQAAAALRAEAGRGAWLLRLREDARGREGRILCARAAVQPRPELDRPCALLVDLGMVLARFDRALLARNFQHAFGQPPAPAGLARMEALRPALEAGDLLADEFLDEALLALNLAAPDRSALARVWGSILSVKRSTTTLIRQLAALPHVAVVVVSNTDPIMLRSVRDDLGLSDLVQQIAASCQDGVRPKGEDASLWERGLDLARRQLDAHPEVVVAIDDIRPYLRSALESGVATHAVHYRGYPLLRYELGALGLYLPMARQATA